MIHMNSRDHDIGNPMRAGAHPVALAAILLLLIVVGIGSIALWRATSERAPETDRAALARQVQARAAQASEQLVEKTKGLETTQQEAIDQLQTVQQELQTVKETLASQQADNKRLADQVSSLADTVAGLGQSFAMVRPDDGSESVARNRPARLRGHALNRNRRKPAKPPS